MGLEQLFLGLWDTETEAAGQKSSHKINNFLSFWNHALPPESFNSTWKFSVFSPLSSWEQQKTQSVVNKKRRAGKRDVWNLVTTWTNCPMFCLFAQGLCKSGKLEETKENKAWVVNLGLSPADSSAPNTSTHRDNFLCSEVAKPMRVNKLVMQMVYTLGSHKTEIRKNLPALCFHVYM